MNRNIARLSFFPLGSSYYPPLHTPDEWVQDVARMAEAGLNAIRTAELIASWEWIEPKKGEFDFGWVDQIFELSQAHGIRIMLGTGAGSPPIWLLDAYPDVQIISQNGAPYPTGTMWGWACIHHPGFCTESDRYLRVLLDRYRSHPALFAWQIHNEPGHPHIQRRTGVVEYHCYCCHCAEAFRKWLQTKYADVQSLSEAWACTPTHHRYHDWSQLQPPRSAPAAWGSPGAWLDWRTFVDHGFARFIAWQNDIIKEMDGEHPTTTNLVHLLDVDLGVVRGIDAWQYPETCDALGFDLYPLNRFVAEPFFSSLQLDYARSPAVHADKPFWIPEIESGAIGEWVLGPTHATTARDIRRYDLDCIAHGAKLILYQGYREWEPLPLHWGALVDLKGEPTERYHEAANINRVVQAHEALFLDAQPLRAQIGILVDPKNNIACVGMGAADMLLKAIKGVYAACWSQHYAVEFITPELLAAGKGEHYRLLLMPFNMLVTPSCAQAVTEFVAGGGTVVGFGKCGMLNEKSWYWRERPGGLTELFGVKETGIKKEEAPVLRPEPGNNVFAGVSGSLHGHWHRQDFEVLEGTEVVARYQDGRAAVTSRKSGAGRAILFGTHFDVAALGDGADRHRQVFANLAGLAGVVPPFTIKGDGRLDGHLLTAGDQHIFIMINHGPQRATAAVHIPTLPPNTTLCDLFSDHPPVTRPSASTLRFDVTLDGYDSTALLLTH
ncbi:MAG: hypothetical protein GY759_13875 [Chloroflexi bacterium]|nr:hypothetical protein [Chloroflexota bacterium]